MVVGKETTKQKNTQQRKKRMHLLAAVLQWLLLSITLLLCESSAVASSPYGAVRFAHAAPYAPRLWIYYNGELAWPAVAYEEVSNRVPVPPGKGRFSFVPSTHPVTPVAEVDVDIVADHAYTLAVSGRDPGAKDIKVTVLRDNQTLPALNDAFVRFVNLSPDAPALDVYITSDNQKEPLWTNVRYGQATDYLRALQVDYTVEITQAGTNNVLHSFSSSIHHRSPYSSFEVGLVSEKTLKAITVLDY